MSSSSRLLAQALRAIKDQSAERLQSLLSQGLDANALEVVDSGACTSISRHILYSAIKADAQDCLKVLLAAGADPLRAKMPNDTPLNRACALERLEMAKMLIDAGDDVNARFEGDWSRLHQRSSPDGSPVWVAPRWTVVHTAASVRSLPLLQLLDNHGANMDVVTEDGRTPLMLTSDSAPATQWLLQTLPHRVNSQDKLGVTALISAVANKNMEVVAALLGANADLELVTNSGVGAAGLAHSLGCLDIAEQIGMYSAALQAREIMLSLRDDLGISRSAGVSR